MQQFFQWILNHPLSSIIVFTGIIQIVPIKINPWSALFKWIGKLITGNACGKIDDLIKQVDENEKDKNPQYEELLTFKNAIEKEKKENLINSFWMLSDEDKKDVRDNIDSYSLDDIEAKLSIICVRKKVNFDSEDSAENKNNTEEENTTVTTYNLEQESNVPAWISACINTQNSKK